MSIKKRKRIGFNVKDKRKKRRARLKAAGKNPDEYFYSGIYLGESKK